MAKVVNQTFFINKQFNTQRDALLHAEEGNTKQPGIKNVPFFSKDGTIYASVTIEIAANGKKTLTPSKGYILFPMKIENVSAKDMGWDPDLIQYPLIGDTRHRCYMTPVPEGLYTQLMDIEWAEAKADTRRRRCRIPAEDGGSKVCRGRSCCGCPMASEDHITSETVSLDAMMEDSHWEVSVRDTTSEDAIASVSDEEFVECLEHLNRKYAVTYVMLKAGFTIEEIAKRLNVTDRMVRNYRSKIADLHKKFAEE